MERFSSQPRTLFYIALALVAVHTLAQAHAGTILYSPTEPTVESGPGERYPESRFGRSAVEVETGVRRGIASTETIREESPPDDANYSEPASTGSTWGRDPAGLEMGVASKPTQSAPRYASNGKGSAAPAKPGVKSVDSGNGAGLSEMEMTAMRRKGVQEVAIIAGDLGFFPKTFFVSRDVPVRLFVTGASKNTLCIMMDSFQVRKQVRSQKIEEIAFTPSMPGRYRFYCPVNGMEGTMVVKELASSASNE